MSSIAAVVSASSPTRDPFMPRRPAGMRAGLALALLAHALLIAGLAFSVDWHGTEPAAVEAELWSTLPQQAAPRAVAPPPAPQPPPQPVTRQPEPPPARQPRPVQPPPPPQVDPQIAVEKLRQAKLAEAQQELAEQEQARLAKARRDRSRQDELDRREAERERQQRQAREQQARDEQARKRVLTEKAEKVEKAENADRVDKAAAAAAAAQQAAARAAYLKRMAGLAGASGESSSTGTALRSSGPSSGYAGRIMARIKPNIVFSDTVDGNPTASVEVKVAPDGTITSRRLVQSSGAKSWDEAVLRAIDRTEKLPLDVDGRVQPTLLISFKRD